MKNSKVIIVCLLAYSVLTMDVKVARCDEYDFRKASWGMSKQEVLASEANRAFRRSYGESGSEDCITSMVTAFDKELVLSYCFIANRLVHASYMRPRGKDYPDAVMLQAYKDFKRTLSKKYGKPIFDKKLEPQKYRSVWETESTTITLKIEKIPYIGYLVYEVELVSKGHAELIKQRDREIQRKMEAKLDEITLEVLSEEFKGHCAKEWPNDYVMQQHCIEEQKQATLELLKGKPHNIPESIFKQIRTKCNNEWPEDYVMRLHCQQEQVEAWRIINQ